jgi:peptidoglycan/xylan/chitin deacetylase (PgdA/CDA1 family)
MTLPTLPDLPMRKFSSDMPHRGPAQRESREFSVASSWDGAESKSSSSSVTEVAVERFLANGALRASPQHRGETLPLHHDGAIDMSLRRKISGRLASNIRFDARRLYNKAPLVSFTFDDVPDSAYVHGAAMLERRGARGTYYVASGLIGRRTPEWTLIDRAGVGDLHRRGHEIGLHTHEHRAVGSYSGEELRVSIEKNRSQIQDIDPGIDPQNFAYPFGLATFGSKWRLSTLVRSSRGIQPGVNAGAFDGQLIKCVELADARLTREQLDCYLDAAVAKNGWLVLLCHDVSALPSPFGCSKSLFERALDGVAARDISMVTVADALAQSWSEVRAFETARLSLTKWGAPYRRDFPETPS